jgi:hypothetical protein
MPKLLQFSRIVMIACNRSWPVADGRLSTQIGRTLSDAQGRVCSDSGHSRQLSFSHQSAKTSQWRSRFRAPHVVHLPDGFVNKKQLFAWFAWSAVTVQNRQCNLWETDI